MPFLSTPNVWIMAGLGEQADDLQDFDKNLFVDALLPSD